MNNIVLETNLSWDQIDENVSKLNYSDSLDESLRWAEQEMKKLKIARNKITSSNSVDKRLSFTSTKYKGYRISLDHKNNCYNIYDKHGELEDYGFTSQLAVKEAVDKLVKSSEVNSSKKVVKYPKKITAGSIPYVKWVKKAEDGSWVMWGGSNSPDIDPDFLDRINHPNFPNPEYNVENQYTDYTVLPAGQSPDEVDASKKITASMMYEDMDGSIAGEVGEYISLEDLVDMYDDLKYYDPIVKDYDSFESWLRDTVNHGYLREVYSSKKITSDEDVEYLDNKDTLREFIDELAENGVDIYDDQDILQELGANYGYDRDDQFAILEDIREYVGQGINSAEEIDDDELETTEQEFTSKDTSINSSKLPAIYKFVNFPKGSVVLDFGGGKFDNGVEYLQSLGCEGYVYDPYNRTAEHNAEVVKAIRANGGADIVLNSNVLNVIKEPSARRTVLKNIKKLVKPNGKVYITVYEGTSKNRNKPGPTPKGYQLNQLTRDYLDEIREVFPDADLQKGNSKLIVATPNGAPVKSSIQASEDSFMLMNEIMDFLEDSGCEDHQQMVDLVSEHFGFEDRSIADFYVDEYELRYCNKPIAESPYMIKSSQDSVTVGIYGDEVPGFEIVDQIVSYFKSKGIEVSGVSGDFDYGWEMNLTGEPRQLFLAVCNKIPGYNSNSVDEFIDEYRIDDSINGCNSINSSEDTISSRIFDFLDECGGYTDYNQKIEDVSEEFGISPDEAEGYVCSWIQNEDAMWHDTADQYEDHDIEESCKVEAALAPFQVNELVKEIQDKLYNKASEVMQSPEFGFPFEELAHYLVIEVEHQPEQNRIKCEVRAELDFGGLMELAEELNPIVESYNKWSYFDAVTSGIIEAYIPLDEVYSSSSSDKKSVTASYSEPEDLVKEYEIVFDTTATVTEDSFEVDATDELNEIYDDEYNIVVENDPDSILENLQDLIEVNMPYEPGKYRISGIAHMKYFIDNLYREYESPSDPDDALGSSWFNSEDADITYDARSSYVEAFQVEKL